MQSIIRQALNQSVGQSAIMQGSQLLRQLVIQ